MAAYGDIEAALEGMAYGAELDVQTRVAGNSANFGKPAVVYDGDSEKAYQYLLDKSVLTFDADFVSLNSIAVTVNGLSITPVVFDTDHATTFAALIAAIDGLTGVTATAGAGRSINIITQGAVAVVTAEVTLGASQAGSSQVLSCSAALFGVFRRIQKVDGKYNQYDVTNIIREGQVWVMTADAVVANTAAYLVAATGVFTDESSGNVATGWKFRTSTSAAGLARLELEQ